MNGFKLENIMNGLVADRIQNRGQGSGFLSVLFHVLLYNFSRGIGRVVVHHYDTVPKLWHGFNDLADLVFFVVGGNDDGDGLVVEHEKMVDWML